MKKRSKQRKPTKTLRKSPKQIYVHLWEDVGHVKYRQLRSVADLRRSLTDVGESRSQQDRESVIGRAGVWLATFIRKAFKSPAVCRGAVLVLPPDFGTLIVTETLQSLTIQTVTLAEVHSPRLPTLPDISDD